MTGWSATRAAWLGVVLALVVVACGDSAGESGSDGSDGAATTSSAEPSVPETEPADTSTTVEEVTTSEANESSSTTMDDSTESTVEDGGALVAPFDASEFDETSATVDNPLFPLVPGTHHEFEGSVNDGDERIDRKVILDVTDLVKTIGGIETTVIRELDYDDGELVEAELAFFAQATDGTVWFLGEYPEEYEEGELVGTPAWINGVEGAVAGIFMEVDPQSGGPSYAEGWGPAVGWTDRAQIGGVEDETCVPAGCYQNVLIVEEFNPEEEEAWQLKYYAEGVGSIKVGWRGDGEVDQETLELVEDRMLDDSEMETLRAEALELEARGYEESPDVYGTTEPVRPRE